MTKTISKKARRRQQQDDGRQKQQQEQQKNQRHRHRRRGQQQQQPAAAAALLARQSRQIRAVHDQDTIRFYQAYQEETATMAVAANSFRAPWEAGLWSNTRMTWIKPSKAWMAYRCKFTVFEQNNNNNNNNSNNNKDGGGGDGGDRHHHRHHPPQQKVLALDVSRPEWEKLMLQHAVVVHDSVKINDTNNNNATTTDNNSNNNNNNNNNNNDNSPIVLVQWDPERQLSIDGSQGYTTVLGDDDNNNNNNKSKSVRSIQIGLRGPAIEKLLDETFVLRISDVTEDFQLAAKALQEGDLDRACEALWPSHLPQETLIQDLPEELCQVLEIQPTTTPAAKDDNNDDKRRELRREGGQDTEDEEE